MRIKSEKWEMVLICTKQTNSFDLRENLFTKQIYIVHPGLCSATRECDWKQAEVGGNRSFSLKLICWPTEHEDWSDACAIRKPTLVQSLICQSYVRRVQLRKVIFLRQEHWKRVYVSCWLCITGNELKALKNLDDFSLKTVSFACSSFRWAKNNWHFQQSEWESTIAHQTEFKTPHVRL